MLYRLVADADVFVTNFPLPVRDRLKLAPADLLPLNPRLIYASFTAYGEAGDEAAKTGFDSTAYWARTGLMDAVRADVDTPPARSAPGMGDHPSATGLYAAIVTALYRREKTGKGGVVQFVAAAERPVGQRLLRADAAVRRAGAASAAARAGAECARQPLSLPRRPLVHHGAVQRAAAVAPLAERDRPRGPGGRSALRHQGGAQAERRRAGCELDAVFATRDLAEWRKILDAVGVTFGVVGRIDDVADDAQMQAIGALVPFADGKTLTVSSPFHLDGETKVAPRRAPAVGQHSEDVLREAGYSADDIGRLRKLGVLA